MERKFRKTFQSFWLRLVRVLAKTKRCVPSRCSVSLLVCQSVSSRPSSVEPLALTVVSPFHHPTVFPNLYRSHIIPLTRYSAVHSKAMFTSSLHAHRESSALSDRSLPVSVSRSGSISQWSKAVAWPSPYCPCISISSTHYSRAASATVAALKSLSLARCVGVWLPFKLICFGVYWSAL